MITYEEHIAHLDAHIAHMEAYGRQERERRGVELRRWLEDAEAEGNELCAGYYRERLAEWEKRRLAG